MSTGLKRSLLILCAMAVTGLVIAIALSGSENEAMMLLRDFARPG